MAESYAGEEGVNDALTRYPLSYEDIALHQEQDVTLQRLFKSNKRYVKETYVHAKKSYELITRDRKIVVPRVLQKRTVEYYHTLLCHPGETRTELTIGQHYCWLGMRNTVKSVCSKCQACQLTKPKLKKLGHLPPKQADIVPWETLCLDLIGPYVIGTGKKQIKLHCLTMIDPATGWFEIVEIPDKRADEIANLIKQTWLSRYPWPENVILDRGKEFMAEVITLFQDEYGIRRNVITTRNPQANSMVERVHQTIHNLIHVQRIRDRDDLPDGNDPWKGTLSAVAFAMRATVHTTTQATPTQLVFNRDALHNVRFEADWKYIRERKQCLIQQNNKRENAKHQPYTYQVNDQVMVLQHPSRKHGEDRYRGPYTVSAVHDNGTVTLRQGTNNGGAVYQTWNIRNIFPYKA